MSLDEKGTKNWDSWKRDWRGRNGAVACAPSWLRESGWDRRSACDEAAPWLTGLPADGPVPLLRGPLVHPADPLQPWPSAFSHWRNLFRVSRGKGRRTGWDSPEPPVLIPGVHREILRVSARLFSCVFVFSKRRTSIFVGGGRRAWGEGSLTSPASCVGGRLGATGKAVGGGASPTLHYTEHSDLDTLHHSPLSLFVK